MSGTQQIVKIPNGGTIAVRTGVLRGAGPQGPMGPQGPKGDAGATGPQGPAGSINSLISRLSSSASLGVGFNAWYPATLDTRGQDDLLVSSNDGLNLQFKNSITALLVVIAKFETTRAPSSGGVAAGGRQLRFVDAGGNVLNGSQVSVEAAHNEPTWVVMMNVIQPDPSKFYHLEAQARDDLGVTLSQRYCTIAQIGAGPPGPAGPQGPVGSTGPQGAQGPAGSAGSGYATYNAVISGSGDSTVAPAGVTYATTPDQGLRLPNGTQMPSTPYFMTRLAQDIEPLLVSRYASAAVRSSKRATRSAGEITYLADSGSLQFRELSGADNNIARVIVSTATPPSGSGQAAPGVIWIQQ